MKTDQHFFVLMSSVHGTLKMEMTLEDNNIQFKTVAKPRSIGEECGMIIRIKCDDCQSFIALAKNTNNKITGIYQKTDNTWKPVSFSS